MFTYRNWRWILWRTVILTYEKSCDSPIHKLDTWAGKEWQNLAITTVGSHLNHVVTQTRLPSRELATLSWIAAMETNIIYTCQSKTNIKLVRKRHEISLSSSGPYILLGPTLLLLIHENDMKFWSSFTASRPCSLQTELRKKLLTCPCLELFLSWNLLA